MQDRRTYDLSGSALLRMCWSGGMHATTKLNNAAHNGTVIKSPILPATRLTFFHARVVPRLTFFAHGDENHPD